MSFPNGGQRDEYNPIRKMTRADWEAEQQAALSELNGAQGDAWPTQAWSAGESRNRAYTYSKYTGSEAPEEHAPVQDEEEDNTMRDLISGVVNNSMDDHFTPYEAPQGAYGLGFGGRHAYSKHTGADKGQSDEDWMFDNVTAGMEPKKGAIGGRSTYSKYNSATYPKYED